MREFYPTIEKKLRNVVGDRSFKFSLLSQSHNLSQLRGSFVIHPNHYYSHHVQHSKHFKTLLTNSCVFQVRILFLTWLPCILRMSRPGQETGTDTSHMSMQIRDLELRDRSSKSLLANVLDIDDDFRHNTYQSSSHHASFYRHDDPTSGTGANSGVGMIHTSGGGNSCIGPHRELSLILKELRMITEKIRKDEEASEITNDWKFAAMVVDRLCLIIFTLFTIIATIAVLLSAPHIIVN